MMNNNKLMKIMLLVTVIVLISCSKNHALKNTNINIVITDEVIEEVIIDVSYVDESFFEKYDTYESFIQDEYDSKIAFIPNVPVKDFSWLELGISFDDASDEFFYEIDEVLYNLEELHPQKPLIVSWQEVGIMSCFGFSYRDKDGVKKYFVGYVGNYGMGPEEYDGPDLVISPFSPETVLSVQLYIIHENIPKLYFREMGYIKDGEIFITGLDIINSETKEVINRINLLDYTLSSDPIAGDKLIIEFIDVNFDGYDDLKIYDSSSANYWNEHYLYFLWDMGKNMYVSDTQGLSELGNPRFDEEE